MTMNLGLLTDRDWQLLQLLISGKTEVEEIARALGITPSAANHQIDGLQIRLKMPSRCRLCWLAGRLSMSGPVTRTRSVRGQW
jgi:DNA-binding NarL/FixJ family response regulator